MKNELFFVASVLSYFYLERHYGLGIIVSFINFVAMSTVPGIIPVGLALIAFVAHVVLVALEELPKFFTSRYPCPSHFDTMSIYLHSDYCPVAIHSQSDYDIVAIPYLSISLGGTKATSPST